MSGATALRPRSMMLWPPILTTLTQGRIARFGVASVAFWMAASVSDEPTSRRPRSVSRPGSGVSGIRDLPRGEGEGPEFERVRLHRRRVERAELGRRPFGEAAHRL